MDNETKSFCAAWVIPVDRPPIRDGVVSVQNNLITSVGRFQPKQQSSNNLIDLGPAALIPGLVNAHTHLEFGYLDQPLGAQGIEFTHWIRKVVGSRSESNQQPDKKATIIRQGLAESFRSGVWCIADIATTPVTVQQYVDDDRPESIDQMAQVVFHELLGRNASQYRKKLEHLTKFLDDAKSCPLSTGISPHAPYSVHPQLLDLLCQQAVQRKLPLAMHLAETPAERELLENQTGPFVELLKDFGMWQASSFVPARTIIDYLKALAVATRSLVIHGNYLKDDEIEFIASVADKMSVVFCPRTHHYFEHNAYPLEQLTRSGICVAVGTDSRASNPDLNLFEELRFISRSFPTISTADILKMGTLNGATALGIDERLGSISIGKRAALSFLTSPPGISKDRDPMEWILDDSVSCSPVNLALKS